MIRYALRCDAAHDFESWFQSADAFDTLKASNHVTCPICGSTEVEKAVMAPPVRAARKAEKAAQDHAAQISALRKEIEANSEYVGGNFVKEARAIHDGDAPERSIYGEAKPEDAKALIKEGVPVAPLPFTPTRKLS